MAGYRETFIRLSNYWTGKLPAPWVISLYNQPVILPFYHIISDSKPAHVKHLYPVKTIAQFKNDLEYLLKWFQPTDLPTFLRHDSYRSKGNKVEFLLTFDDGLREFHDVIAPILFQKGIPAVCFLNSSFIDNKDLFFRYKASLLIEKLRLNPQIGSKPELIRWSDNISTKGNITDQIRNNTFQERHLLDTCAQIMEVDFYTYLSDHKPYLTSDQIHTLTDQGFVFGGHSMDHPLFADLNTDEQLHQTISSVQFVKEHFQQQHHLFSFPFTDYGVGPEFFKRLKELFAVDAIFGSGGMVMNKNNLHYQRFSLESETMSARNIIHSEIIYHWLKLKLR